MSKKKCIECDYEFRGRSDKKFCSDSCRSQYNNRRYKANETVVLVNKILKRNYRILKKLRNTLEKDRVPVDYLIMEGFIMNYFTHIRKNENENIQCCYNYGITLEGNGLVRIHEGF